MCEIKTKFVIDNKPVVICTGYDGDFMSAKSISLFNKSGRVANVTKFVMEKTKQCFNNNPISPVFRIDENISDDFLQIGNRVDFNQHKPNVTLTKKVNARIPKRQLAYA